MSIGGGAIKWSWRSSAQIHVDGPILKIEAFGAVTMGSSVLAARKLGILNFIADDPTSIIKTRTQDRTPVTRFPNPYFQQVHICKKGLFSIVCLLS